MAQDRGRAKSWGNGIVLKCLLREGLDMLCFFVTYEFSDSVRDSSDFWNSHISHYSHFLVGTTQ